MEDYVLNKLISEFMDRTDKPFKNKWQTFMETDYSFMLACTGIEAKQYDLKVLENRPIVNIKMSKFFPLNIDTFCND